MIFKQIDNLFWFFSLLPVVLLYALGHKRRNVRLKQFIHPRMWRRIIPSLSYTRRFWKRLLLLLSIICLILAALRPQYGVIFKQIERKGHNIYIALDVSKSMLAQDVQPFRLAHAKREILGLVEELKGDRIGLIIFAGESFIQCPLTFDYNALKMLLTYVDEYSVPTPGSDIATAIKTARTSFKKVGDDSNNILVLISDGENFENDPLESAEVAKDENMVIYSIGIGLSEGEPIPEYNEKRQLLGYKKDKDGQVILSKLNEGVLKQVAEITGGKYYNSTIGEFVLDKVYKDISLSEKKQLEEELLSIHEDRYQWFLALALLFFWIQMLISDRRVVK